MKPSSDFEIKNKFCQVHQLCVDELENEFERENSDVELTYLFLEKELENRSLTTLEQLPVKGTDVIRLVNSLPAHPLLFATMQKMNMTECLEFPLLEQHLLDTTNFSKKKNPISPYLTGTGFHSASDKSTYREHVFAPGDLSYPSVIGFGIPTHMKCLRIGRIFNIFKVFRNKNAFTAHRLKELQLPPGLQFKGNPQSGYNISHSKTYADIAFTYVREYRLFSLTMKPSAELNPSFVTRLKEICTYRVDEFFGLKQWEELFSTNGTHCIHSANGGGKIIVTILESQLKNYFKTEELFRKEKEIEELLSLYLDSEDGENECLFEGLTLSSIKFQGGDPKFELLDLVKCKSRKEMRVEMKEWIGTLPFHPVMLESAIAVESIPDILERKGLGSEAMILDNASKKLWGKTFRTNTKRSPEDQKLTRWSFW